MAVRTDIEALGLTSAQFVETAGRTAMPRERALQAYRRFMREGVEAEHIALPPAAPIGQVLEEGKTLKFTQEIGDGLETESVILPQESRTGRRRVSLCVSSQVGCAMGCEFCETAQMGLLRSLSAAQIVGQWWTARFRFHAPISNIVFMGMGEPMDNLGAVVQAIRVFTDRNGPGVASSRISVSTVGRAAGIEQLADLAREEGFRQLGLAVSINAPNDDVRSRIMPINRAEPMEALRQAMRRWPVSPRRRILIEYVLIPDVNDAPQHAAELAAYLNGLCCTVNVIPYNPRRDSPWPAPGEASVERFVERLAASGQFVKRRRTMGRSVMAACGQLGNARVRARRVQV